MFTLSSTAKLLAIVPRATRSSTSITLRAFSTGTPSRTLYEKIWDDHVVDKQDDGTCLIYIDRHLVHEVTSPQAFEGLKLANRDVRRRDCTLVTPDHNVPTSKDRLQGKLADEPQSLIQVMALDKNAREYKLPYFELADKRQGIVHIIGPEQGFSQPGLTLVCGDSHTATHGAFGALAFGIGTSEVEHVLATQTLMQTPSNNMRISVNGPLPLGVTSKDLILHVIGVIGTAGGNGSVIEYAGDTIRGLSMESRMTICNMSIEAGARAGLIAPDDVTFRYLKGRPMAPQGDLWDKAVAYWKTLPSDADATYQTEVTVEAKDIAPQVTWGTNPEMVAAITDSVPIPDDEQDEGKRAAYTRALEYMGLTAGMKLEDVVVDKVFIGSCTNGRIEDLRAVAEVVKGHKLADNIKTAMVVPGSGLVRRMAEDEGIDQILIAAGFDWREPGCSMCLGMNADQLEPGERCASTSNRNFEGRQGRGGRTHLVSPAMAAAAAITGRLADVRKFMKSNPSGKAPSGVRSMSTSSRRMSTSAAGWSGVMEPFVSLEAHAAPLPVGNMDTDMIIPATYLKTIKRTGLGSALLATLRYNDDGSEKPDFVLNQPAYRTANTLITGENFGCGSSREHAPWALLDFGIRAVVGPSFADIFYNNCFKNGILPVELPQEQVDELLSAAADQSSFTIDLESQSVTLKDGKVFKFEVDPFRKNCLINGLDDIGLTLAKEDKIAAYEANRKVAFPWLEQGSSSVKPLEG